MRTFLLNIFFKVCFALLLYGCSLPSNTITFSPETIKVQVTQEELNNTLVPSTKLFSENFIFPGEVSKIVIDTPEMKALVFTRLTKSNPGLKPGSIIYYDLTAKKPLWTINSFASEVLFLSDKIILQGSGKVFGLSKTTGDKLWERNGSYGLFSKEFNVGFTGYITAFDLSTGKDLWQRTIKTKLGWDKSFVHDSLLIRAADGLHAFNFKTGSGWDLQMQSGKVDELGALAKDIGKGILVGLVGRSYYGSTSPNVFSGLTSNILVKDNKVFFSAMNNFVCVDLLTGKEVWRTVLPEKNTGKVSLLLNGPDILLINHGYCYKNGEVFNYGVPYFAKFNKSSGEKIFSSSLQAVAPVEMLSPRSDGYYFISKDALLHYNPNGTVKAKFVIDAKNSLKYGNFISFPHRFDSLFLTVSDAKFTYAASPQSESPAICVRSGNAYTFFNGQLDAVQTYFFNQLYFPVYASADKKLLRMFEEEIQPSIPSGKPSVNTYYYIDKQNSLVGKIVTPHPIAVSKDLFYSVDKNSILTFRLPE